jgi:hypothetical protein
MISAVAARLDIFASFLRLRLSFLQNRALQFQEVMRNEFDWRPRFPGESRVLNPPSCLRVGGSRVIFKLMELVHNCLLDKSDPVNLCMIPKEAELFPGVSHRSDDRLGLNKNSGVPFTVEDMHLGMQLSDC